MFQWHSLSFQGTSIMSVHTVPFFIKQSVICLSLVIQFSSILPFHFTFLMSNISTQSLQSAIWLVVLALSQRDLLSVYVIVCGDGWNRDHSAASWWIKSAESIPSVNARASAARVDLATCLSLLDFQEMRHDVLFLSAKKTKHPPWLQLSKMLL